MWGHECCRVFQDRLVSMEDHAIFQKCLDDVCVNELKTTWEKTKGPTTPLLYGNFSNIQLDEEKRTYVEMVSISKANTVPQNVVCNYR